MAAKLDVMRGKEGTFSQKFWPTELPRSRKDAAKMVSGNQMGPHALI